MFAKFAELDNFYLAVQVKKLLSPQGRGKR
jgi:hypothetical protein